MGVYRSKPRTEKKSEDGGEVPVIRYGITSMQGWRRNMEDAHIAISDLKDVPSISLFGVFDGHGGPAVSEWIRQHFEEEFALNLASIVKKFEDKELSVDLDIPCDLQTAIQKWLGASETNRTDKFGDETKANGERCSRSEVCESNTGEDDDGIIEDENEERVSPKGLSINTLYVCEAFQKTFMSLDVRMRLQESRDELKKIHEELEAEDAAEDGDASSADLPSLIQMYLNAGKNGTIRVGEDVPGSKLIQYICHDDEADGEFSSPADYDEFDDDSTKIEPSDDVEMLSADNGSEDNITDTADRIHPRVEVLDADSPVEGEEEARQMPSAAAVRGAAKLEAVDEPEGEKSPSPSSELRDTDMTEEKVATPGAVSTPIGKSAETVKRSSETQRKAKKPVKMSPDFEEDSTTVSKIDDSDEDNANHSDEAVIPIDESNIVFGESEDTLKDEALKEKRMEEGAVEVEDQTESSGPKVMLPYEPEHCGSTAVVTAVIRGENPILVAANAGDSRVVLCRNGIAIPLSKDHKPNLSRETRRILAAGGKVMMGRVDGNLNLSRCVGDLAYKIDSNIPQEAQKITSFPDVRVLPLHSDDEFAVIACDGIWDCLGNQELVDYIRRRLYDSKGADASGPMASAEDRPTLSQICEEVCDRCIANDPLDSEGIGCDNMTIMILEFGNTLKEKADESPDGQSAGPRIYSGRLYKKL